MIRDAHRLLLTGVARHRGASVEAGELKRDQNWIGGVGRIDSARFIPAPPGETPEALDRLFADRAHWAERRDRARHFVETDRNWSSNISRYVPVYQKLTGKAL